MGGALELPDMIEHAEGNAGGVFANTGERSRRPPVVEDRTHDEQQG